MSTQITDANKSRQPAPVTIKQLLNSDSMRAQIAAALPQHMKAERMIRVATTAMLRTPKLAECDQASFFKALLDLSAWGLEPDGRRAHLIPFRNNKRNITECQLILDYKGLVELARRSGEVATIHADVVCKNDEFSYAFGSEQHLKHRPNMEDRGQVLGAYAHVRLKDGTEQFEVLSKGEIDGIKKRSRSGNDGPWVTDYNEMAKKTAFRRLSKWLPISAEMADAFEADADTIRSERDVTATGRATVSVPDLLRDEPVKQHPADLAATEAKHAATFIGRQHGDEPPAVAEEMPLDEQPEASWGDEQQQEQTQPPAETPPAKQEEPAAAPAKPKAVKPKDWKEHVVHFGKNTEGKKLGSLHISQLQWFTDTWLPQVEASDAATKEDKALIEALHAFKATL